MVPPLYIAVSGKIGSGKDYIMENFLIPLLSRDIAVSKMAFADHIKINVASQDNIAIETVLQGSKKPEIRKKLQIQGTEEGRDKYGEDIWINTLENWIRLRTCRGDKLDIVLITDCRFPNEAAWIERNGGLLIRTSAPDRNSIALDKEAGSDLAVRAAIETHRSETALDDYHFTYTIDNRIGSDAETQLKELVMKYLKSNLNRAVLFNNL